MSGLPEGKAFTKCWDPILDICMAEFGGAAFKVLMFVVRRTFGYNCRSAVISIDQFCNGFDGQGRGTGLTPNAVRGAIKELVGDEEGKGVLLVQYAAKSNHAHRYAINLAYRGSSASNNAVQKMQCKKCTAKNEVVISETAGEGASSPFKNCSAENEAEGTAKNAARLSSIEQTEEQIDSPHPSDGPQGGKSSRVDRPSTVEEATEYFLQLRGGTAAMAAAFYDFFCSNGWKVSGRTAMKDWQASARGWHRRETDRLGGGDRASPGSSGGSKVREVDDPDGFIKRHLGGG